MFKQLKQALRTRVMGPRFVQQLHDDHHALAGLGNALYAQQVPALRPLHFQPPFNAHEFSCYSQNGEDGLILHLLAAVGAVDHYIVEIGTEDGRECNSANLVLNFGWRACLVEMDAAAVHRARPYFAGLGAAERICLLNACATPENINELLAQAGAPSHIDVLSIDIDSHDYWLWQSIEAVNPRLVVIEYNAAFGPDRALTVPYPVPVTDGPLRRYYHGASLTALARLGARKGYVLVGCDTRGVNSFFVRRDLASAARLQEVTPQQAFRVHQRRSRYRDQAAQWQALENRPLVTID